MPFVAGPRSSRRHRRGHGDADLGFTQAGLTGNKGLLPNGYAFRPEPLDRFRHYVGRAMRNETNATGIHDDACSDVDRRRCDASQLSRSYGSYRTDRPSFKKAGPPPYTLNLFKLLSERPTYAAASGAEIMHRDNEVAGTDVSSLFREGIRTIASV